MSKKETKYTSDGKFSVFSGNLEIARSYVIPYKSDRNVEVRIFQGMDRDKTIAKICQDCPDFAK